jgi:hypothetical protein
MRFDTHGNGNGLDDLYILPENEDEKVKVVFFLMENHRGFQYSRSNVKGQDWYGKTFIDIPFGESLREAIAAL